MDKRASFFTHIFIMKWISALFLIASCSAQVPTFGQGIEEYQLRSLREKDASFAYHPSPVDWRDMPMYQILTDRFDNGDVKNDNIRGWLGVGDWRKAQGGDWRGITNRLDYIKQLGFRTIWISPVHRNITFDSVYKPYHAYHPTDFYTVEPQFGNLLDLQTLVKEAHARGIAVVIDVVVNHMADLASLANGKNTTWNAKGNGSLKWNHTGVTHAAPFNDLTLFNNNGPAYVMQPDGNPYGDPDPNSFENEMKGEFIGGLDDFNYDKLTTAKMISDAFQKLIDATDCDGLRVDAVKHVSHEFLAAIFQPVRKHAESLGKKNFIVFGEAFEGRADILASFINDKEMTSMMDFPLHFAIEEVFGKGAATAKLKENTDDLAKQYPAGAMSQLVRFIDTHDTDRILGMASGNEQRLTAALTFLLLSDGVPCVYYGTEQKFTGKLKGDQQRETMWASKGAPDAGPAQGENFSSNMITQEITRLLKMREENEVFRRGTSQCIFSDANAPGAYIFERKLGAQTATISINTSNQSLNLGDRKLRPFACDIQVK